MPQIPIGSALNLNGATRVLNGANLKSLNWRPGGVYPATESGSYPYGDPSVGTMTQWISGYQSGAWGSWLPYGSPPTGTEAGVYYPQWSTLPNNFEIEVYPNGDAMTLLGSNPYHIDSNGNFVIQPRLLNTEELATVAATSSSVGVAQIKNCTWLSGAGVTMPYGLTPPYIMGARVELPTPFVQGMWPAIWILRDDGNWPPEIDILEAVAPGGTFEATSSIHSSDTTTYPNGYVTNIVSTAFNPLSGFHDYFAMVYNDYISIFWDGVCVCNFATPTDWTNWAGYLIFDYGIAGAGNGWPGPLANGTTSLPSMTIADVIALTMPSTYGTGSTLGYVPPSGTSPITLSSSTPTGPTGPTGSTGTTGPTQIQVNANLAIVTTQLINASTSLSSASQLIVTTQANLYSANVAFANANTALITAQANLTKAEAALIAAVHAANTALTTAQIDIAVVSAAISLANVTVSSTEKLY